MVVLVYLKIRIVKQTSVTLVSPLHLVAYSRHLPKGKWVLVEGED